MLQMLLDRLYRTNSKDERILYWLGVYEEKALDLLAAEHCIACDGLGHTASQKCPTYQTMLSIASQICTPASVVAFKDLMRLEFERYAIKAKGEVENQFNFKKNITSKLQYNFINEHERKQAQKEEKSVGKIKESLKRQLGE